MIDHLLADIASMSANDLRLEWHDRFRESVPSLPISLLRRALGYRLQEEAFGGLHRSVAKAIEILVADGGRLP